MSRSRNHQRRRKDRAWSAWQAEWRARRDDILTGKRRVRVYHDRALRRRRARQDDNWWNLFMHRVKMDSQRAISSATSTNPVYYQSGSSAPTSSMTGS